MTTFLAGFFTLLFALSVKAALTPSVRAHLSEEDFSVHSHFRVHEVLPTSTVCGGLASIGPLPPIVKNALDRTNTAFRVERLWTDDLVDSREPLARKYQSRSYYKILTDDDGKVVASIGLTEAHYTRENLPDPFKSPPENEAAGFEILPKEESLGYMLTRPLDSQGKGIILELRMYFVDGKSYPNPRASLLNLMFEMIQARLASYPELDQAQIIHTFNTWDGVRLYPRYFGFGFDPETPVTSSGIWKYDLHWWGLVASKNTIEDRYIETIIGSKRVSVTAGKYPHT